MLRLLAAVICVLGLAACAEVPPAPGTGGSGGGGTGGGGTGGTGETSACEVAWTRTMQLEEADNVVEDTPVRGALLLDVVAGTVSESGDLTDVWSFTTTCEGLHDITLAWDAMGQGFDLDLLGRDTQLIPEHSEIGDRREERLAGVPIDAGEPFTVEVQAVHTEGLALGLGYDLTALPSD